MASCRRAFAVPSCALTLMWPRMCSGSGTGASTGHRFQGGNALPCPHLKSIMEADWSHASPTARGNARPPTFRRILRLLALLRDEQTTGVKLTSLRDKAKEEQVEDKLIP